MTSNLAKTYQKKTDKQHVLDNPDTYTGSMTTTEYDTYVFNDTSNKIEAKQINIIPGLYKLFDEGIVNCRDHYIRMKQKESKEQVTQIHIQIENNKITMYNNGNGIDKMLSINNEITEGFVKIPASKYKLNPDKSLDFKKDDTILNSFSNTLDNLMK